MATSRIPPLEMESVDAPVAPSDCFSIKIPPLEIEVAVLSNRFRVSVFYFFSRAFVFALYMVIVRTILNAGDVKVSSAVIHDVNPSFTSANTSVSFSAAVNMSVTLIKTASLTPFLIESISTFL
ncbi:hypothetical protein QVD17_20978 [Tagetes erecta]|uniref:Uncharacterized protein n=1 Tax=Tagetes erecta TaxID=13708 RepID=A0AAD8KM85_TARER|nr:hypothetical protein QVD17_20978 [Tagetes erecta]